MSIRKMGSIFTKQTIQSPNLAITYMRSTMIDTENSVNLEIPKYNVSQIKKMLDESTDKLSVRKQTILDVLYHNDFKTHFPEKQREIYFIDTHCNSIVHIRNTDTMLDSTMDRVMAVNLDVLDGKLYKN